MGMRNITAPIGHHLVNLIEALRQHLHDPAFRARHRIRPQDFTRKRSLTFPVVMLLILQKTVKSVQRHLHEFLAQVASENADVTPGGWTQARAKLKHTAFYELNQSCVLPAVYNRDQAPPPRRWKDHRLLAIDSSLIRLPNSQDIVKAFGLITVSNQNGDTGTEYPQARISVLYDVLNRIGLDARLEPSTVGEIDLALDHLIHFEKLDVALVDRGFAGYVLLAHFIRANKDVVARCSTGSFLAAQELFRLNRAGQSKRVCLLAPSDQRATLLALGLPLQIVVRFVSLRLSTGELEVLVTTLLDEATYPTQEFKEVYHCRWGIETYYGDLKGRLDLENFSGLTAEAVRQDFYAAVLLCNLESILTGPANQVLTDHRSECKYPQQVNRADSFHALKTHVLDILYRDTPAAEVVRKLQRLFLSNPVSVRKERKVPRRKLSLYRSYHFQRRVKKIVF
jgi:hypothetical protein